MLKDLGVSALKDFIGLLKKESNFFSSDEKTRKLILSKAFGESYPEAFMDYLSTTTDDLFLKEFKQSLAVFDKSTYADSKNNFLNALAQYISKDFSHQFDQLTITFFFEPLPERLKMLNDLFPGSSFLYQTIRDLVMQSTYQEIGKLANEALSTLKGIPSVIIQTPVELESSMRLTIRSLLLEKYPFSFPEFQITPQIIGGLRVFAGGKVMDHSWMGKIQSLANLNNVMTR